MEGGKDSLLTRMDSFFPLKLRASVEGGIALGVSIAAGWAANYFYDATTASGIGTGVFAVISAGFVMAETAINHLKMTGKTADSGDAVVVKSPDDIHPDADDVIERAAEGYGPWKPVGSKKR